MTYHAPASSRVRHPLQRMKPVDPQQRYHAAADTTRLYGARWMAPEISVDSAMEFDLQMIRDRSRMLYRDDTLGGAIDSRVNHVIGTGFTPQSKIRAVPGLSEEAAKGLNDEIEALYEVWSQDCEVNGKFGFWEAARLCERHNAFDGESFTVLSDVHVSGSPIPLRIEIVDPDRVQTPPGKANDPLCRLGIQYDAAKRIVGYWIRQTNPFDHKDVSQEFDYIEAGRVIHVLERWFAGQTRGYPWMTRVLRRAKDVDDLDEAGIIAAQVEACHTVFVKTQGNSANFAKKRAEDQTADGHRVEDLQPGTAVYGPDIDSVSFASPTKTNSVGTLHEWNYRRISAGIDYPYEMLVKNWGGLSFAAGRLVLASAELDCRVRQKLMRVRWYSALWQQMIREGVLFGALEISKTAYQRRPHVYSRHVWTPPRWPYSVNPIDDIRAKSLAVSENFVTRASVCAEYEGDYENIIRERGAEVARETAAGCLPPDTMRSYAPQGLGQLTGAEPL